MFGNWIQIPVSIVNMQFILVLNKKSIKDEKKDHYMGLERHIAK